jgi:hypothetical protein
MAGQGGQKVPAVGSIPEFKNAGIGNVSHAVQRIKVGRACHELRHVSIPNECTSLPTPAHPQPSRETFGTTYNNPG